MRSDLICSQMRVHFYQEKYLLTAFCSLAILVMLLVLRYFGKILEFSAVVSKKAAPLEWVHLGFIGAGLPITLWTGKSAIQIALFVHKAPPKKKTPPSSRENPTPPLPTRVPSPQSSTPPRKKVDPFSKSAPNFSAFFEQFREKKAESPDAYPSERQPTPSKPTSSGSSSSSGNYVAPLGDQEYQAKLKVQRDAQRDAQKGIFNKPSEAITESPCKN